MGDGTRIEWTDATWNPVVGCTRVSEGCDHCYAITQVHLHAKTTPQHRGLTERRENRIDWNGRVNLADQVLDHPLRWTRARQIFTPSLSDLFQTAIDDQTIARIFAVMALANQHTFQVLTKRPKRMAELLVQADWWEEVAAATCEFGDADDRTIWLIGADGNLTGLPNVWLGTSIELDKYSWRADHLRATPAAVRFVSAEPLLGPLPSLDLTGIDWLIVGGESGPGARPMHPAWVRNLRDRCTAPTPSEHCPSAPEDDPGHCGHWYDCEPCHRCGDDTRDPGCDCNTCVAARLPAFFFKQWGTWLPFEPDAQAPFWNGQHPDHQLVDGHTFPAELTTGDDPAPAGWRYDDNPAGDPVIWRRTGKTAAGRQLDGRTWDEMPEAPR
jgi:protein gp37